MDHQVIDRASADDVMTLVSDCHDPPPQVGAILLLAVVSSPGGADEESVLAYAAGQVTARLSRDRPLWSATLLISEGAGPAALILVVHHVLADGIAGLAVLGRLVDGGPVEPALDFPRPAPSPVRLAAEAAASRLGSLRHLPELIHRLAGAVCELGPSLRTHATPCSLIRPTSVHRRLRTVRSDLASVVQLAHQSGTTVNDVILAAVTGALHELLVGRGEDVSAFVVSIPVSSRHEMIGDLGNHSGVITISADPDACPELDRLQGEVGRQLPGHGLRPLFERTDTA